MQITNEDRDYIYIDFKRKFMGGKCKAGNWKEQIETLRGEVE